MKVMRISLGSGILKTQGLTKVSKILDTIQEFGIDMDMLDSLDLHYDDLYQVYSNIKCYRRSVGYLKGLKTAMARKNHEV